MTGILANFIVMFKKEYKKDWAFYWDITRPIWKKIWWIFLLVPVLVFFNMFEPYIYKLIFDQIEFLVRGEGLDKVLPLLGLWVVIFFSNLMVAGVFEFNFARTIPWFEHEFLKKVYRDFLHKDLGYYLNTKTGELGHNMERTSDSMWSLAFEVIDNILPSMLDFVVGLVVMISINIYMTGLVLLTVPFWTYLNFSIGQKNRIAQDSLQERYNSFYGRVADVLSNFFLVKSFTAEQYEFDKSAKEHRDMSQKHVIVSLRWSLLGILERVFNNLGKIILIGGGIILINYKMATLGDLFLFTTLSGYITNPVRQLRNWIKNVQKDLIRIRKVRHMFEKMNKIKELPNAPDLTVKGAQIEFSAVKFSYQKAGVLNNLTATFPAGKMTALVGHSGAGKTTIVNLLNRFFEVKSGSIKIDGIDIRSVSLASLRRNIAMVMQENSLLNSTLRENLKYGNLKASNKQLWEALEKAQLAEFVKGLPKGLDTRVGERGLKLSGGQKQRMAIARAFLKNAPILVLDEATSALDTATEVEIQKAFKELSKGRTTIVIAHRLSTVRLADQILVMEKGKVLERGKHADLIKIKKGHYKKMVDLQHAGLLNDA